ncbi:hypothetical protein CANARDRAFT_6781 [[Candida] arabinofermentans NRRL YB-2248]|uniref:Uncharacterized protein n=1 Tax=[Candida] arabinofermentans NRRL YB-2248 TaxID=983967 RepID=A0A1E4T3I5_9ASCO|nr:hypothetical protein CANARDRAFT_6781 [[Candida] arabinofermentans NRRL YB-2248]
MERPSTPLDPDSNDTFQVPDQDIPQELASALELDESEDEDEDEDGDAAMSDIKDENDEQEVVVLTMDNIMNNKVTSPTASDRTTTSLNTYSSNTTVDQMMPQANPHNFFDINTVHIQPLNPFGNNNFLTSSTSRRYGQSNTAISHPLPPSQTKTTSHRKLSMSQQSRLVTYIDHNLLKIQRKFIKYMSLKPDGEPTSISNKQQEPQQTSVDDEASKQLDISKFTLPHIIAGLSDVATMIWYSTFQTKQIPIVAHSNIFSSHSETQHEPLNIDVDFQVSQFGQTAYIVKILGDFSEYLDKYPLLDFDSWLMVLKFLAECDNMVSYFIDYQEQTELVRLGLDPNDVDLETDDILNSTRSDIMAGVRGDMLLISTTEKIRLESIVNRIKLQLVEKFDHFKEVLEDEQQQTGTGKRGRGEVEDGDLAQKFTTFEGYVGEVFEGIGDRTSI